MELLTSQEKESFKQAVADAQDTWSRILTATKVGDKVILSENPDYNYAYGDSQPSVTIQQNLTQKTFKARIKYVDSLSEELRELVNSDIDLRLDITKQLVRIRVEEDAYLFLKESNQAAFDNKNFQMISSARPKYVFGKYYYYIYLQENQ